MPTSSLALLEFGFVACALTLAAILVGGAYLAGRRLGEAQAQSRRWAVVTAVAVAGWMVVTWAVAAAGSLADFSRRPPPFVALFIVVLSLGTGLAFSPFGTRLVRGLPLWALVGSQAFRLPLEVLMHQASLEGLMPVQMSYSGWNFDIVTGASAIPVAWILARRHTGGPLAVSWNLLGTVLLAAILTIAVLSTPVVAVFGPDRLNTFVAHPPFVWLPSVMVVFAILGHWLVARKLKAERKQRGTS
jgi:cytochrome bd-type quinol oxidase subunit 2